jgi:AGZA family xanthine/uracil permease-like MFS transporter
MESRSVMPWFVRGDIDGFFGLALDNLVQLLLVDGLCRDVLGFSDALLYGRVLPGVAVSLLVGNLFYAHQARALTRRTGVEACALPYGINTVSLFAHVFLVMLPAKLAATAAGAPDPARVAWQAGLAACLGSGLIELIGSTVAERLRRAAPRAALLSTLAGIALGFISLGFLFRTFARPLVGLTTLAIVVVTYFGKRRFRFGLPGGLVAVTLGTLLSWATGIAPHGAMPRASLSLHAPLPAVADLFTALAAGHALTYLGVIVPMGLFNLVGSLQNIESAEASGDVYATAPSLVVNGLGSIAASLFGSCFPTTIYIGHPGWKAMGARAGYSVANAAFFTVVALTGTLGLLAWAVPIEAGMAIVLWIGLVITSQAFEATPRAHAPAVVIGLLPGVGAWGALMAKNGLRAAGYGTPGGPSFSETLLPLFEQSDTFIHGAFALEQGFIFTAMILSALTVAVIEQRFIQAALWCWAGALLSACGLMHAYAFTPGDTVGKMTPALPWAAGYLLAGLVFAAAKWATVPGGDAH